MSVLVRRLAERGLVARVADNGNCHRVQLEVTPAGRDVLRDSPATVQSRLIDALHEMDAVRLDQLSTLLEERLQTAGIHTSAPPMFLEEPCPASGPDGVAA